MSRVSLARFSDNSCTIPLDLAPTTYHVGARRWLYFMDRSQANPSMNLRDLVLLPCSADEVNRLFCVTLGIKNAPGATAAGTDLMRDFGLHIKYEQAYDSLSGDIGSKTCLVVFPNGTNPKDFDDFVAKQVAEMRPGCHLIRKAKANRNQVNIHANYASELNAYFGYYVQARRYLPQPKNVEVTFIDQIEIQGEPATIHETPPSMALRLTDPQRRKVETLLAKVYGDEHGLEGLFVQVSREADFEALSFSFLDPDDILCFLEMHLGGNIDEINKVVKWLGDRGVDFRQYRIIENHSEGGYEFRLLCDLAQTDLHLFDQATLKELLFAELDQCLSSPTRASASNLRIRDVSYKHATLTLYNNFTDRDRFHLSVILFLDARGHVVRAWPQPLDDSVLLEEVIKACKDAGSIPTHTKLIQPQRHVFFCQHEREPLTVAAVYDNRAPDNFGTQFRHFCQQSLPANDDDALTQVVRKYLLCGLNYSVLLPSRGRFDAFGNLPRDAFSRENDQRFSSLGWDYIVEKWERDKFAFRGNVELADMLGKFLADRNDIRRRLMQFRGDKVRILDIGPGVGALTTALAIRRNAILWDNLDHVELVFLDSVQRVLDLNRDAMGYCELPRQLLEDLQFSREEDLKRFIALLKRATHLCCDVSDPGAIRALTDREQIGAFDIVYSGFCHHHMNRSMKAAACQSMADLAKENAFVGIVDESLTYKQFLLYRIGHSLDQVEIATESYFQSFKEHADLFGEQLVQKGSKDRVGNNKFYAFWGEARPARKPDTAITPKPHAKESVTQKHEEVATMLREMKRLSLLELVVVGKYLRYDPRVRNTLKDWVGRIKGPLLAKTRARENFLIWAAPGSGKTFLIQQIAETLKGSVDYVECNLAKDEKANFIREVNSLPNRTRPVLCLLDEIDARGNEDWPYEECFPKLDLNADTNQQVVIVLIGSTQSSVESMVEAMRRRHKGPDLLSRVLLGENAFAIPSMTQEDSIAMVIGQIVTSLGERVKSVEKSALLYILCDELLRNSPRQLSEFVKRAATRFRKEDERLRFHHLFRSEDHETMFKFRETHKKLLDELREIDVQVSR